MSGAQEVAGYPPSGIYRLFLSDGDVFVRPMSPDWVWGDTFGGAHIIGWERIDHDQG